MSVRNAVAKAESAARAPARVSPADTVRQVIDRQSSAFAAVLPANVDPDRWSRITLSAVKGTPKLMEAFGTEQGQVSVLLAAMNCAAVGLEPNTPLQEAWITPRKNKGVMEGQLVIGYRGLLKLARQSGEIAEVYAEVVRDGDEFHYERNLDRDILRHVPNPDAPEDEESLRYAYAVVRYTNGGRDFVVMSRSQIHRRRAVADSWRFESSRPYSPWTMWPDEQWRKTALKALAKRMPLSAEAHQADHVDDARLELSNGGVEVIHVQNNPAGELAAPAGVDPDTGEVDDVPEATADHEPEDPPERDPEPERDIVEATATDTDDTPDDPAYEGADRAQLNRLSIHLRAEGIDKASGKIAWASEVLGRDVAGWGGDHISQAEADELLARFPAEEA